MESKSKLGFNPWKSILTKPRETIRGIIEYNSNYHLLLLSIIYGFSALLGIAQKFKVGEQLDFISLIIPVILLAPIWGYIVFSVGAWFVYLTGKLIKGKAEYKHVRAAIAWSNVPSIASGVLWVLLMVAYGRNLFSDLATKETLSTGQVWGIFSALFVMFIISIWSLVIYINALAEVQKFSVLKAILNIILSTIVIILISFLITLALRWTCSSFFESPTLVLFF